MIAIVDHGDPATRLLERTLQQLGASVVVAASVDVIQRASKLIVSGSGPFGRAAQAIRDRAFVGSLMRAIREGRPYLGIGIGLHLLFDVSYEAGQHTGFGVLSGKSIPFEIDQSDPVRRQFIPPHMGWSPVRWVDRCPLLRGLAPGESFYFNHGAHSQPLDSAVGVAQSRFGVDFVAVVWRGNVYGTQFVPEQSQQAGRQVLENFVNL